MLHDAEGTARILIRPREPYPLLTAIARLRARLPMTAMKQLRVERSAHDARALLALAQPKET